MKMQSEKYETIFQQYQNALSWISQIGVRIGRGRLASYNSFLDKLLKEYKNISKDTLRKLFPQAVNAFYEVDAICSIYESLHSLNTEQLLGIKEKLNKAVSGPESVNDETETSNAPRNFLFEVLVSSRIHNPYKGVKADFFSNTDTAAEFLQKKYFIECKRIQSIENLGKNIKKAANQLNNSLKTKIGSNNRGLIAIDVSKVINPQFKLFVKQDDNTLQKGVNALLDSFVREYDHIWQNILTRKSKKIVGVILRLSLMGISEERNLLVTCSQWGINPKVNISEFESMHLRELVYTLDYKQKLFST